MMNCRVLTSVFAYSVLLIIGLQESIAQVDGTRVKNANQKKESPETKIQVPLLFENKAPSKKVTEITRIGVLKDDEKIVIAIEWADLDKLKKASGDLNIYLDTDNNAGTGRPGGCDYQIRYNVERERLLQPLFWWTPKPGEEKLADEVCPDWRKDGAVMERMALYPDDFFIAKEKNAIAIILKNRVFNKRPIRSNIPSRFLTVAPPLPHDVWEGRWHTPENRGYFSVSFGFPGFAAGASFSLEMRPADLIPIVASKGLEVWDAGMQKVPVETKTSFSGGSERKIEMKAARGEYESRSIVIYSDKTPKTVSFELKNAPNGIQMETSRVVGVKDIYGMIRPDRLVPLNSEVPYDMQNTYWLIFHVSRDAKEGVYPLNVKAKVETSKGTQTIDIPVDFTIFNFTLPKKAYLTTAFAISWGSIKKYAEITQELRNWYFDHFAERRMGLRIIDPAPKYNWDGKTLVIDWTDFDVSARRYLDSDSRPLFQPVLAQLGSHDVMSRLKEFGITSAKGPEFKNFWTQYTKQLMEHVQKNGWQDQVMFCVWDEPYTCWDDIMTAIKIARETAPHLRPAIFVGHFEPRLKGLVGVWIGAGRRPEELRERVEAGDGVWTYNPPVNGLLTTSSELRAYYWRLQQDGISGCSQYSMNNWKTKEDFKKVNKDPMSCWVYPNPDGTAQSSMRWEITREAVEDYDYLTMLKQLADSEALDADSRNQAQTLLRKSRDLVGSIEKKDKISFWELQELRNEIGKFLSEHNVDGCVK